MKKIVSIFCLFFACHAVFSQGQFIVGVKGGINGCFYTFNSSASNIPYANLNGTGYTKVVSKGPSIPALFELIYGTKKFRVGYQFEYERILTTSYSYKSYNSYGSFNDTAINDASITQHFFCHNLLIEYIVYDNSKNLRLVPDITFGYFHGVSNADLAPYDFSALNANRFKFGAALNLEYYRGPYTLVTTPSFTVAPVKSVIDPNEKGYMFFVGINIGLRFDVTKLKKENSANPKKKKKEYINPEEDNN
jgi:hypothetical protein